MFLCSQENEYHGDETMKVVFINSVPYGSTGRICTDICSTLKGRGEEVYLSFGYSYHPIKEIENSYIKIGSIFDKFCHMKLSNLSGKHGMYSKCATHKLIRKLIEIKPDILHLHNLHGWFINLPILFDYIKKNDIKVIWTLHDCWAFTGQCPHFTMVNCQKWRTGCYDCPQYRDYPSTRVDRSSEMYELKKEWFTGVKNMTIVTPSQWLADLVKQSFLKEYPVKVINNGIDLNVFKPTESDFRKKHNLEDKKIVLGVAFGWGVRKGLDVFIELSKRLPDNYKIVLVGTDESADKQLPSNILSIHRTQNQKELAEIYTAADVFANPTREENYPTVNMESLACGTPVITFKTGGSPEIIDENTGVVVDVDDVNSLETEIIYLCNSADASEKCTERAKSFDKNIKFAEYCDLYLQK